MDGEGLLQQVFLCAVSALFGYWMHVDLKRHSSKKSLEAKKDAKSFVRPYIIKTDNEFEVYVSCMLAFIKVLNLFFFFFANLVSNFFCLFLVALFLISKNRMTYINASISTTFEYFAEL